MKDKRNKGMAIVMVLGVLAVTLLLVVHVMTICEVISRDAYASSKRLELRYQAESGADHAFWMHLADRKLFPSRKLGIDNDSRLGDSDFEPWMADRRAHQLFDANCQAYIDTIERSIWPTKTDSFKKNVDVDDTDTLEIIDNFLDVLGDYTDSDSLTKLAGKEEDDYAAEGLFSMPRNGALQFAEELFWLDGWTDVITSEVTIIPPKGKNLAENTKPSFFSASPTEIQTTLDLSDSELAEVIDARNQWINSGTLISDSLSSDLYANILGAFSFQESDYACFVVSSATNEGELRILYKAVREVNLSKNSIYADSAQESFSIWRRTIW